MYVWDVQTVTFDPALSSIDILECGPFSYVTTVTALDPTKYSYVEPTITFLPDDLATDLGPVNIEIIATLGVYELTTTTNAIFTILDPCLTTLITSSAIVNDMLTTVLLGSPVT